MNKKQLTQEDFETVYSDNTCIQEEQENNNSELSFFGIGLLAALVGSVIVSIVAVELINYFWK